ncbi:MAG: hypothetical protein LBV39_06110 [Bacteroidales bacterium]|jgi:hypothetical protein|nr:hypothetical protein [Bacteroidales bacterium]
MKRISLICIFFLNFAIISFADEPERLRRSESFLGVHFDFHAGADCNEIGKNTTPEMVNAIIDKVHPDYLQIDSKGHPGYTSYPTKVGNQAPGFVGDPLRIWRNETAKRGVALYMHYSGVWDTRALELHPEWSVVNADGTKNHDKTSVFGQYPEQLLIPQLKELAGDYGVDGVWVDGECWATVPDYSERAIQLFRETTGIESVPRKSDDPYWFEWLQFHREGFRKYLRHYVAAVRSVYPDFQLCSNWAFTDHMPEPVSVPLDFLSGDYSPNNSVNSARYAGRYLIHQGIPWDLMAWSFCNDPIQQKTIPQLQREAAVVLALGGGFQAYFTQNRDGSVRLPELDVMAEVAKFARERQPYCHHSQQIPQVALIYSTEAFQHQNVYGLFNRYNDNKLSGILQCLLEGQNSVDLIGEDLLGTNIDRFPLVVFPEWNYISATFRDDLLMYVKKGGNLLVIGEESTKLFALHANVNIKNNDIPVITKLGEGQIAFIPQDVGLTYADKKTEKLRQMVNATVKKLFPHQLVEVSGSPWVDVSVSKTNGKTTIHLVNTSGNHKDAGIIENITPTAPLTLAIRCDVKPSRITLQPYGKNLEFIYNKGKAEVKIPPVAIYDILIIE